MIVGSPKLVGECALGDFIEIRNFGGKVRLKLRLLDAFELSVSVEFCVLYVLYFSSNLTD